MSDATLLAAAFGSEPGRWPLPTATTSTGLWLRAVAAGGQGRYGSALTDLAALDRAALGPVPSALASASLSTRASFLRQQGWHQRARGGDGAALACAGGDTAATLDALSGLAADALGLGRLALAADLLARAIAVHRDADAPAPRLAIRLAWVQAELAMAAGEGPAALAHARHGVELAAGAAPDLLRHRVKSEVVLAAALCCAGDPTAARRVGDAALLQAETLGLQPLRWALSQLLGEVGSEAHSPAALAGVRADSADFLTRHGARLRHR